MGAVAETLENETLLPQVFGLHQQTALRSEPKNLTQIGQKFNQA